MTIGVIAPQGEASAGASKQRLKKTIVLAAVATAVIAIAAGAWFALFAPHESTISVQAKGASAVPGKPVLVSGTVTPAIAHRVVEVAVGTSAQGPFISAGTAVTDSMGRFQSTWTPAEAGNAWVQATAVEMGRDQQAQATTAPITVRAPATLTLKLSTAAARTTAPATVTATLTPAGGAVTLEKSANGTTWLPLATTTAKAGSATARLSGLTGGTWRIRGKAAQTDTASAAISKQATLLVEDYKAAGAKYLAIVASGNAAVDKLNKLIDDGASLSAVTAQAATLSKAYTQQAVNFRAYKDWPREVSPVIGELAKACVLDADDYHLRSQARSVDEWNAQADRSSAALEAGSAAAARARDLLGLPKRDLHP